MTEVREAPPQAGASRPARKLQGIHVWYELMSPDPDGSKAFYEAVVPGWKIGEPMGGDQDYRMIGLGDGGNAGGLFGLTDDMRQHGARPVWLGYIGVDDVDATVADIEERGGKTLMPAFDIPEVGRIAMVADPQGNPFYVMRPIPPKGQEDKQSDVFSVAKPGHVTWNELTTNDPAAARSFYGELFGWTSEEFMPMGEFGEYRFFFYNGTTIGAVCQAMPGGPTGWRYYIRVPSIPNAVEAVKAGGGTIAMGPHEVPGGDHIVIGFDPQGAEFALTGKA
ncbi:MAG TPA: VOC family protein [Sphingomicrobium sp.]|nr:VOC family protein [Sphingomicrobium sp.]